MNHYDYIFAGAGCAGLSLVHYLLESNLKESKILLIDPLGDSIPNKTWCYWAEKPLEIHPVAHAHFWNRISFLSGESKITKNLGKLNYYHLNSHDFYFSVFEKIKNHPNVNFIQDEVLELAENGNFMEVKTKNNDRFTTTQVIDSRLNSAEITSKSGLKQIFTGWRIKTDQAVFDPSSVILMEFPKQVTDQFEFIYILPFSTTEALVEYTAYSQEFISEQALKDSLENYLKENLGNNPYKITFRESGVIPMSTQRNPSPKQNRVLKIGTAAGWTKASTGYTFHTIQNNCKAIVEALQAGNVENLNFSASSRFAFYDNILLNIAHKWPNKLQNLFINLFTTSSADLVLRFLSEETTFKEELKLLGRLRFPIFIKSLLNYESH
jgi:lycopene beta-cyclase